MSILTLERAPAQNREMGRPKMTGAKFFQLRMTPEDRAFIEAVRTHYGLPDAGATLRFAVRELSRRERLRVEPPAPDPAREGE